MSRVLVNCGVTYEESFFKTLLALAPGASWGVALASTGNRRRLQAETLENPLSLGSLDLASILGFTGQPPTPP